MGHKRWKRLDYVQRKYGIKSLGQFTTDNLLKEVQRIAHKNKKEIRVHKVCEWKNISRAYLSVHSYKITSQWDSSINWDSCIDVCVTGDVERELERIAYSNDVGLEELVRDLIDDFLLNQPQ